MEDLTEIFLYIARDDVAAATRFIEDLHEKIQWIADLGFTGVSRDWISPDLRVLPYRKRCIYFRITADEVHILRVLHSRQDVREQVFVKDDG